MKTPALFGGDPPPAKRVRPDVVVTDTSAFFAMFYNELVVTSLVVMLSFRDILALCGTCKRACEIFRRFLLEPSTVDAIFKQEMTPGGTIYSSAVYRGLDLDDVHYGPPNLSTFVYCRRATTLNIMIVNHVVRPFTRAFDLSQFGTMIPENVIIQIDDVSAGPSTLRFTGATHALQTLYLFGSGTTTLVFDNLVAPNLKRLKLTRMHTILDLGAFSMGSEIDRRPLFVAVIGGSFENLSSKIRNDRVTWTFDSCLIRGDLFLSQLRLFSGAIVRPYPVSQPKYVTFNDKPFTTIPPGNGTGWKLSTDATHTIVATIIDGTRQQKLFTNRAGSADKLKRRLLDLVGTPGQVCAACDVMTVTYLVSIVGTDVPRLCIQHTRDLYLLVAAKKCFTQSAFRALVMP